MITLCFCSHLELTPVVVSFWFPFSLIAADTRTTQISMAPLFRKSSEKISIQSHVATKPSAGAVQTKRIIRYETTLLLV